MNGIQERTTHCFHNVFPEIGLEEIPRASTASLAAWNSVAHVQLLSSIEEEFGLQFEMEDFEELVSYPLILDYLETHATSGKPA